MRVVLPVRMHTKETTQLENLGLDSDYENGMVKDVIFYHIDAINEDSDGEKCYGTAIVSGGQFFACPLSVEEVDRRIQEAMNQA